LSVWEPDVPRTTQYLLLGLAAAGVLWWLARSRRGEAAAADVLEEVVTTARRVGAAVATALTPRGIRNNNPGNIDYSPVPAARWRGTIGSDGRFAIFDSPANGVRAIGGELKASIRKGQTIREAIHEWAPPVENDTGLYVNQVARAIGVDPDARLTLDMLPAAALAIIRHENGQIPYDPADVAVWVYA
jgi:hypothetical protein